MQTQQKIFALITGLALLFLILDLIRRRKLKEEYSWIWFLTGLGIFVLVMWYPFLLFWAKLMGAKIPVTALFLSGFLFLILITLFFSVKLSQLSENVKKLAQKIALMEAKTKKKSSQKKSILKSRRRHH